MTIFYRFDSQEAFIAAGGRDGSDYSKYGIQFSIIGRIPDGGAEPDLDEIGNPVIAAGGEQKPDGSTYLKGEPMTRPTFKAGWHVNASAEVEGWEDMAVVPSQPMRVFG